MRLRSSTALLLNIGHALDHLFLLIFATAVASVATDFGFAQWEDLSLIHISEPTRPY